MNHTELRQKRYDTESGTIAYWVSTDPVPDAPWLVLLPGLTADHRLFEPQIAHFTDAAAAAATDATARPTTDMEDDAIASLAGAEKAGETVAAPANEAADTPTDAATGAVNILAWDPPSHGASRPFPLNWSLDDLARWLRDILQAEGASRPVLVGQSMGGYTAQAYLRLFPDEAAGFISIDSCPLGHEYYAGWELFALKHTKLMYLSIPWNTLKGLGANGCTTTETGRAIMRAMMDDFEKREYCELAAHGFRVLAEAIGPDRAYPLPCPTLLICGTKDMAGSAKRYNRAWEKRTGLPVHWLEGAGHNSNTDAPKAVNQLIGDFLETLQDKEAMDRSRRSRKAL